MTTLDPGPVGGEVPALVLDLAGARTVRPVWRNELGGLTFELVAATGDRQFLKWNPRGNGIDLDAEATRLRWAAGRTSVPRLLAAGAAAEATWLLTAALPGQSAVSERWLGDPATAVTALGQGLRRMHDALPVAGCPFSWDVEHRRPAAHHRSLAGESERRRWHREHQHLTWDAALRLLADPPAVDRLVVCHGDPCAPNTLVGEDGRWSGHVDLGALGVADRWADLAVATWSTGWNYGPGWTRRLLDAYGVEPDEERTAWYRLLWDLT